MEKLPLSSGFISKTRLVGFTPLITFDSSRIREVTCTSLDFTLLVEMEGLGLE